MCCRVELQTRCGSTYYGDTFLAQYMRMKPCILPVCTSCVCAAFQMSSCVCEVSSCARLYTCSRGSVEWSARESRAHLSAWGCSLSTRGCSLGACGHRPRHHGSGPPCGALEVVVVWLVEAKVVGELSPHDGLLEVRFDALAVLGVVLLDEERRALRSDLAEVRVRREVGGGVHLRVGGTTRNVIGDFGRGSRSHRSFQAATVRISGCNRRHPGCSCM